MSVSRADVFALLDRVMRVESRAGQQWDDLRWSGSRRQRRAAWAIYTDLCAVRNQVAALAGPGFLADVAAMLAAADEAER